MAEAAPLPKPHDNLKSEKLRGDIDRYRKQYVARFTRNQYTNNAIIGISIVLTILIAITGTSPVFKDPQNLWSAPLGVSAAAWLGILSTALLSIQKLYNIQSKIIFYPAYILQAEELLEDFGAIKTEADLQAIRDRFRKMRSEEVTKRPVEVSAN